MPGSELGALEYQQDLIAKSAKKYQAVSGTEGGAGRLRLVSDLVFAGFAAGGAVVEPVFPKADVELSLAEDAVLLALTSVFDLFALAAASFCLGGHSQTLAPESW